MAISPIGNAVYVNQNSQAGANANANALARTDGIRVKEFEDKLKDVEESRPPEGSGAVEPDKEGGGGFKEDQKENKKKDLSEKEIKDSIHKSDRLLDVKV